MLSIRDIEVNKGQSSNSHSVREKAKPNNDKTLCCCQSHHTRTQFHCLFLTGRRGAVGKGPGLVRLPLLPFSSVNFSFKYDYDIVDTIYTYIYIYFMNR